MKRGLAIVIGTALAGRSLANQLTRMITDARTPRTP